MPSLHPGWLVQVVADALFVAAWYWLLLAIAQPARTLPADRHCAIRLADGARGAEYRHDLADAARPIQHSQPASCRCYIGALALAIWTLVAIGHILRAALERPLALCLVLALLQMLLEELLFLPYIRPRTVELGAMHVHILGICGTFMGGIAAIARAAGHRVTGSDRNVYPPMSTQLRALGIELIEGYERRAARPRVRTSWWSAMS